MTTWRTLAIVACVSSVAAPSRAQPLDVAPDQSSLEVLRAAVRAAAEEILLRSSGERVRIDWTGAAGLRDPLVEDVAAAIGATGALPAEEGVEDSRQLQVTVSADSTYLTVALQLRGEPVAWWRQLLGLVSADAWAARIRLDPELRRFVAPPTPWSMARVDARPRALPSRGYLAVRVVDLDQDGSNEILLLRDDGVELVGLVSRRVEVLGAAGLPELGATPHRARRAFGTLALFSEGLIARVRAHNAPFAVQWRGGELHTSSVPDPCDGGAHPLDDACALPVEGRDYYASELGSRVGLPVPETAPTSFYARAMVTTRSAHGRGEFGVELVVTPQGRLVAKTAAREVGIAGYGAALGAADTDGDGAIELVTSSDSPLGEGDSLRVLRVREDGTLLRVWESDRLEGSITVAGAGDVDGDGLDELIAIEERESRAILWVIDAAPSPTARLERTR